MVAAADRDLEAPGRRVRDEPVQPHRRRRSAPTCPTPQAGPDLSTVPAGAAGGREGARCSPRRRRSRRSAPTVTSPSRSSPSPAAATAPTCRPRRPRRSSPRSRPPTAPTACRSAPTARCSRSPARSRRAARRIGVLVALVILLIAFGSLLAAGLPLLTAIIGVSASAARSCSSSPASSTSRPSRPTLAAMIGLGVGIDYSLFVINRFRQAVHAGPRREAGRARGGQHLGSCRRLRRVDRRSSPCSACSSCASTSSTVSRSPRPAPCCSSCSRPCGCCRRCSRCSATAPSRRCRGSPRTPSRTAATARRRRSSWSCSASPPSARSASPGRRPRRSPSPRHRAAGGRPRPVVLHDHPRLAHEREYHPEGGRWAHYGRLLQKRPIIPALLSLGLVLVLAIPALVAAPGLPRRLGHARGQHLAASPTTSPPRASAPAPTARSFVAVELPKNGDVEGLGAVIAALAGTEGVAEDRARTRRCCRCSAPSCRTRRVTAIQVQPTTGPQDEATSELLERLRTETIPAVNAEHRRRRPTSVARTAIVEDFSTVMRDAMPIFLSGRRRPRLPHAAGAVPLGRGLADRRRHEPAVVRGVDRHHRRGVPVGLAQRPARRHRDRADLPVPARSWCSRSCSACRWTTRCSWSAGCRRSGPVRTTTPSPYAAASPAPAASCSWRR